VVNHITLIGEACRALPDEFQASHANVPWADIIAMRNPLVHHYFGIDAALSEMESAFSIL